MPNYWRDVLGEDDRDYGEGATLTGQILGTIASDDSDHVRIDAFESAVLNRPTLRVWVFELDEQTDFNAYPPLDNRQQPLEPTMSFSGDDLWFRVCARGFTSEDPDFTGLGNNDCGLSNDEGGGFWFTSYPSKVDDWWGGPITSTADGTGGSRRGYRITDAYWDTPIGTSGDWDDKDWGLVPLAEGAVVHPSAYLGGGTTVARDVVIEAFATLGEDVSISQDAFVGEHAEVGARSSLGQGSVVCAHVVIGEGVDVGRNVLVEEDVPDGSELDGQDEAPDPKDCPRRRRR